MADSALYPGFKNPLLGSPRKDLPKHVAIVGAGTIGPDIGYYLKAALPDITLTLVDVVAEPLEASKRPLRGVRRQERQARQDEAGGGREGPGQHRLTPRTTTPSPTADLVIEAATESIPLKKKIFAMIEERVAPTTIIASNTSSIPAEIIFADMKHPERTTVTHFFAPGLAQPGGGGHHLGRSPTAARWTTCAGSSPSPARRRW